MLDELVRDAIAIRIVDLSQPVSAAIIVDAVRDVAGVDYVERTLYVNDRVDYVVGRKSRAPSENVVVAANDAPLTMRRFDTTKTYSRFVVVNGVLDGRTLSAIEGKHLFYRQVKAFAERVRLAVEERIKDPRIALSRPPVALVPSDVAE